MSLVLKKWLMSWNFIDCPEERKPREPREPKPERQREPQACFTCGDTAHLNRDCPNKPPREPKQDDRSCYNCGGVGHLSKDCTEERKEQRRERPGN